MGAHRAETVLHGRPQGTTHWQLYMRVARCLAWTAASLHSPDSCTSCQRVRACSIFQLPEETVAMFCKARGGLVNLVLWDFLPAVSKTSPLSYSPKTGGGPAGGRKGEYRQLWGACECQINTRWIRRWIRKQQKKYIHGKEREYTPISFLSGISEMAFSNL